MPLGKRKGKDNAFPGQSIKATRTRVVGNEGDDKEEEEEKVAIGGHSKKDEENDKEEKEKICCVICSSKTHRCRCCPWNKRIPLDYVPEVGANWVVVCMTCGIERKPTDPNKFCSCGYHGKYVVEKMCCACFQIGHTSHKDEACRFFGKTGVDDPFYQLTKRMLEGLGIDPETNLEIPQD